MLVEAARTMFLIFSCAPLFLWAEAIATACYTQNRSIIHCRFDKTPYEFLNCRKSDISFLHVFGALCYPKNDREDIGKLDTKAMAFEQSSSKPELQSKTFGQISLRLDLTYAPSIITSKKPTERELDLLFEALENPFRTRSYLCSASQLHVTGRNFLLALRHAGVLSLPGGGSWRCRLGWLGLSRLGCGRFGEGGAGVVALLDSSLDLDLHRGIVFNGTGRSTAPMHVALSVYALYSLSPWGCLCYLSKLSMIKVILESSGGFDQSEDGVGGVGALVNADNILGAILLNFDRRTGDTITGSLVLKCIVASGSEQTTESNVGMCDLLGNVYGVGEVSFFPSVSLKRRCIHQSESTFHCDEQLRMFKILFAKCAQQEVPPSSMNNVDASSMSNRRSHVGDVSDSQANSLPMEQTCSVTKQKVVVGDGKSILTVVPTALFTTDVKKPPLMPGGYIKISKKKLLQNLEITSGTRINAWVETMRASSSTFNRQDKITWMVSTDVDPHFMMEDESLLWTSNDVVILLQHGSEKIPLNLARGVQFSTIMQFNTSLSSLAQSLIISLWFDLVDCHDYPSRGYHELYTVQRFVQRCVHVSYTLTKWYQEPGYDEQWQKTKGHFQNQCLKLVASRDKLVDCDDTLVCCVENMIKDRIMDSSASFHATYCKEELERFKLRFGKVRLADDKTLDIAGVGDVVLKTSFGTSWTLKDVRWFGEVKEAFLHNVREDKETAEVEASSYRRLWPYIYCINIRIYLATMILLSKTAAGVAIGNSSNEMRYNFRDTKSHQVIQSKDITFVDSVYEARYETISSSLTKPIQKSEVVLVDIPENLVKNDSIVSEHGLKDKMKRTLKTEHPPRREAPRLYSYEGPAESPGLYKESVHGKKAIIEEMVSLEKNQTCSLVRLPAGKMASQSL
ncbi:retrovirus-related pol polyprotein from transposon TNT 1-94 [Tanacetum coccineum]|uniref:Retrovirus-related pol polyprotein from transposon TNT 1-94 n=1 Tax=Tanacetum coccineum TaxID=301880 RepID=A0ABQ5IQX0_9ASTR